MAVTHEGCTRMTVWQEGYPGMAGAAGRLPADDSITGKVMGY